MKERHDFRNSRGWFHKFQKRCKKIGLLDPNGEAAARQFLYGFQEIISEGNYLPEQVFNAAEMLLNWRRLPSRTTVNKIDRTRNKISNDRISLLLCGNAAGDFVVKPMLVTRVVRPQSLENRHLESLPVFWQSRPPKSQKQPVVTAELFFEWLQKCFIPEVRDYLNATNLPQRVLLLIDPQLLEGCQQLPSIDTFVEFEFFPANTAKLLQPLGHKVLPSFACNYLQRLLAHMLALMDVNPDFSLYSLWNQITVTDCIEIIQESLEDMNAACWNSGWALIWNEIVREPFQRPTFSVELERILQVAHGLPGYGFADMTKQDIARFLKKNPSLSTIFQLHGSFDHLLMDEPETGNNSYEELPADIQNCFFYNEGEMIETEQSRDEESTVSFESISIDENSDVSKNSESVKKLSLKNVNKIFSMAEDLIEHMQAVDPQHERSERFQKDMKQLLQPYRELKESLSQRSIRDFFSTIIRSPTHIFDLDTI